MKSSNISVLLVSAFLSACGGSEGQNTGSYSKYDLASYQQRSVTSDSIVGTWVAVGTGKKSYKTYFGDEFILEFAIKEYFILTQQGEQYSKKSCEYRNGIDGLTFIVSGSDVSYSGNGFQGVLSNNTSIEGKLDSSDAVPDSYEGANNSGNLRTQIDFEMIKISDEVDPFVIVDVDYENAVTLEDDAYCFQQSNGYATKNGAYIAQFKSAKAHLLELDVWDKASEFSMHEENSYYQYREDFIAGDNVAYSISEDNGQEILTFSVNTDEESISGSVTVDLP